MTVEVSLVITCVSVISAILFGFAAWKRGTTTDARTDAVEQATINVKLDNISHGVDEIKVEQRSLNKDIRDLTERVSAVEQSTKSAHKRIDDMAVAKEE